MSSMYSPQQSTVIAGPSEYSSPPMGYGSPSRSVMYVGQGATMAYTAPGYEYPRHSPPMPYAQHVGYQEVDEVRTYARPLPQNYGYEAQFVPPQIIDEPEEPREEPRARPKVQRSAPPPKARSPSPEIKKEKKKVQRSAAPPAAPAKPEIQYRDVIVEKFVDQVKYVEVEVEVEKIKYVDKPVYVDKVVERRVEVPVEVERRVEIPVPYEKIVHVEVPVERTVYREVPVPVYGEERVITKEVTVPVEVIKEVTVPVEHVVTKEVEVPVEIGQRSETRVGESRIVIGEETRASAMTAEHHRSTVAYNGPTSIGNTTGVAGVSGGYSGYPGVYGSTNGSYVRAEGAYNYGSMSAYSPGRQGVNYPGSPGSAQRW